MHSSHKHAGILLASSAALALVCGCLGASTRSTIGPSPVSATAPSSRPARAVDWQGPIEVRGVERNYLLHLPASYDSGKAVPLVLVFHGGRGSGKRAAQLTGFNELADRKGFIVAYPDGLDGHWNDGRPQPSGEPPAADDVAFIATLINHLGTMFSIDPKRIYATGISNGAIFAQRLACELPDKFAAIAPVAGTLAKDFAAAHKPARPVSVLMIHGTADEFVPYNGGQVRGDIHGQVLSAADTVSLWLSADRCDPKTCQQSTMESRSDGTTRVQCQTWIGTAGATVSLYTIEGGGHTWPGARLPRLAGRVLGPTSQDFNATAVIWDFFDLHPKL